MQEPIPFSPVFVVSAIIIVVILLILAVSLLKYPFDQRMKMWGLGWLVLAVPSGLSVLSPSSVAGPIDFIAVLGIVLGSTLMLNGSMKGAPRIFSARVYLAVVMITVIYDIVVFLFQLATRIVYILPEFYAGIAAFVFLRSVWKHYPVVGPFVWLISFATLGWALSAVCVSILLFFPEDLLPYYLTFQGATVSLIGVGLYGRSTKLSHDTLERQNTLTLLLASVIHHDIRNYIQLIAQALELAQTEKTNSNEWLALASQVLGNLTNFLGEVRQVTGEIARFQKKARPVELSSIVRSIVVLIKNVYASEKLNIVCDIDEPLNVVSNELVREVIYNIFDNAIKHGSPVLEIRNECVNEHILLIIEDRAGGISPQLFRFLNGPDDISKAPGVGLGVILIKGLAPFCHTRVQVENVLEEGQPVGCRYKLRFHKADSES